MGQRLPPRHEPEAVREQFLPEHSENGAPIGNTAIGNTAFAVVTGRAQYQLWACQNDQAAQGPP
jgi:hypothetical protein